LPDDEPPGLRDAPRHPPEKEERKRIAGGFFAWFTKNVRTEGKVAYDRYSDEGGVSGRDGSTKSIELSGAYQYR
jgi:hypothetical protein